MLSKRKDGTQEALDQRKAHNNGKKDLRKLGFAAIRACELLRHFAEQPLWHNTRLVGLSKLWWAYALDIVNSFDVLMVQTDKDVDRGEKSLPSIRLGGQERGGLYHSAEGQMALLESALQDLTTVDSLTDRHDVLIELVQCYKSLATQQALTYAQEAQAIAYYQEAMAIEEQLDCP